MNTERPQQDGTEAPVVHVLRSYKEHHSCKLTDLEKIQKGHDLARLLEDIKSEESHADMVKASLKSKLTALEAQRDNLGLIVGRGAEIREVEIQEQLDLKAQRVLKVRMDTGEVVGERTMTPEERQQQLKLVPPTQQATEEAPATT